MRGTIRKTIKARGKQRSVMIEKRPIAGRPSKPAAAMEPVITPVAPLLRPIAAEVAQAVAERPVRFPGEWWG